MVVTAVEAVCGVYCGRVELGVGLTRGFVAAWCFDDDDAGFSA